MEDQKGSKPHPLVLVARWETVGEGGSAEEGGRWWRETRRRGHSGGIWSTRSGRLAARGRGRAGGRVGAGGAAVEARFDGGLELAGVQVDGGGVLGSGDGETAKERGDQLAGVFVVLMHAKDRELRLYLGRATAAVRWRPAGRSGVRGTRWRAPARGKRAVETVVHDAWGSSASKRWPGWP